MEEEEHNSSSSPVPDTSHLAVMGTNKCSCVLGYLSSPLLSLVSVQVMLCPHLYCLSSTVLVCLCFFHLNLTRSALLCYVVICIVRASYRRRYTEALYLIWDLVNRHSLYMSKPS